MDRQTYNQVNGQINLIGRKALSCDNTIPPPPPPRRMINYANMIFGSLKYATD